LRLYQYTIGYLRPRTGARGRGTAAALPREELIQLELEKAKVLQEPFVTIQPPVRLAEVSEEEKAQFIKELEDDPAFQNACREAAQPTDGLEIPHELLKRKLPEGVRPRSGVLVATAKLAWTAGEVLVRIISRFRKGRDHGVYATVVEELLRQFFFTNVGAKVWGAMKEQAESTFENVEGAAPRGGWLLVEQLAQACRQASRPQVSLVGHS